MLQARRLKERLARRLKDRLVSISDRGGDVAITWQGVRAGAGSVALQAASLDVELATGLVAGEVHELMVRPARLRPAGWSAWRARLKVSIDGLSDVHVDDAKLAGDGAAMAAMGAITGLWGGGAPQAEQFRGRGCVVGRQLEELDGWSNQAVRQASVDASPWALGRCRISRPVW